MGNLNGDINKILLVGYGSMGRRRIRLTSELLPEASFVIVDSNPERQKQALEAGYTAFESLGKGIAEKPDIAYVCTSPGHHADIIIPLLTAGIHVFTELNLTADRYDEMERVASENKAVLFISSTLIYKRQMQFFHNAVKVLNKPVTYNYHVGQYLSDWHPWENYKDFFIGRRETNGVREIMAIQLPWIIDTFGSVKTVNVTYQRCTYLDIDFPDSVILTFTHKNGNIGTFMVDVVSRKATTHLEIIGEDIHIVWNGHNDDLYKMNLETKRLESVRLYKSEEHIEGYADNIAEEPYRDEIKSFIATISGEKERYGLKEDAKVLELIDSIEANYM